MGRPGPAGGIGVQWPYANYPVTLPWVNQTPSAGSSGGIGTRLSSGFALHIGVDTVNGKSYGGWTGSLKSSVSDAQAMAQLSASLGYTGATLTDGDATSYAVMSGIGGLGSICRPGDTVLLTFSGHGGQVPTGIDDRPGGVADTWVLYDRMLIDDEIRAVFASFAAGVRIVVISDCCHSGSDDDIEPGPPEGGGGVLPELRPRVIQPKASNANVRKFAPVFDAAMPLAWSHYDIAADTLLLAACGDDEEAWEDATHGVFTSALLSVWADGDYEGDYDKFLALVAQKVRSLAEGQPQTPRIHLYGGSGVSSLRAQRPFVLAPASDASLSGGASSTVSVSFSGAQPPASVTVTFDR